MNFLKKIIFLSTLWAFNNYANGAFKYKIIDNRNKFTSILPEKYIKDMRPIESKGHAMNITFSIKVVDINSINVEDMDFRMDMFLTQEWIDPRLQLSEDLFENSDEHVSLPTQYFEEFWQPDLYFLNCKLTEIATLTYKYSSVTIFRNKTIRYAARMYAIVACQMEFQHYPMDIQYCPLTIESFTYISDKMLLKWGNPGVTVSPELKLLQYDIIPLRPSDLKESVTFIPEKFGNFSRLIVNFSFERQIGHHLIITFAPSTLIVVLSWFSFWLGLDAIPGRVTLLITCMLTLVTMFTGLRSDIPPVAYVKAIDLWMAGCMVFVFAAVGEFVIVKVLHSQYVDIEEELNIRDVLPMGDFKSNNGGAIITWASLATKQKAEKKKVVHRWGIFRLFWKDKKTGTRKILWQEIDKFARIIFPLSFILFLIIFWPLLIYRRK